MNLRTPRAGIYAVAVIAAQLAACNGRLDPVPADVSVVLDERATLSIGQSITIGGNNVLRITFRDVEADSRCPVDVQCVWSGDAEVLFRIEYRGHVIGGTTLHTHLEPQRIVINNQFALRLVSLAPDNRVGSTIDPGAYRATILVSTPE